MAPTVRLRPDLALASLLPTLTATFALTLALASIAHAGVTQRSFRFSPADLTVESAGDGAIVGFRGAVPSEEAGAPEVPVVPAFVALPAGERVVRVEVEASGWSEVGSPIGRVRPAGAVSPGLPRIASVPATEIYGADAWYPRVAGVRGTSGQLRGRNLAGVALYPVRVMPQSGRIEVAGEIVVRVVTEPDPDAHLDARRRVVPEWDREFFEIYEGHALGLDSHDARENIAADAKIQHVGELSSAPGQGFAPTGVPSVEGSPVQYLIVTSAAMSGELQRLADWRTKTGMPTIVRTLEFIQANYHYGFDLQDRVRRFVRDAYLQWGVTHVLLAGDTDLLPVRYARTRFYNGNFLPTDLYFSDLDGNWNADGDSLFGEAFEDSIQSGDGVNMYPDVYVGRAPILTLAQAQTFVNKVLQYSKTPLGNYENRILLAGEVLFPQNWEFPNPISLDGAEDCEAAITHLGPEMAPVRLYENYTQYDTVDALPETREAVIDSLNHGWGFFHHVGHGFRNTMSCGNEAITNADVDLLTNGNKTYCMYAINCTSVAVDFASIGEAFLLNPNGGAVANIGATREDFPVTSRSYLDEYYKLVFTDKVATIGEAFAKQKLPFIGLAFYDNTHRWTQYVLNMLGDPAMPLWWRKPLLMSVGHSANVPLSDTTFTVTVTQGGPPVVGARVCLMKAGEEYEVVLTNGAGQAVMHVRPETAGVASLVVTAKGNRPHEGTVNFTGSGSAMLVQRAADRVVDDDNAGGTNGSADLSADAGETIDWLLPVKNIGGAPSGAVVNGTLSSADPRVTVLTPASSYGTIGAGATNAGTAYRIHIQPTTGDGAEPLFKLDLVSGANHWIDEFRLPIKAPTMLLVGNVVIDNGSNGTVGNSNGRLEIGELVDFTVSLRNVSTGIARNLTATLSSTAPGISIPTPAATIGNVAWNATATSTAFRILNSGAANPKFTLTVSDPYGVRFTRELDALTPVGVVGLVGTGAASSITLVWKKSSSSDLAGYNIYRATTLGGPYTKVNTAPTDRTAMFVDEALPPLTAYFYQIAAVDSSGNESTKSTSANASTNPPVHSGFPLPTEHTMSSALAIGNIDNSNDSSIEIVAGSNVLYMWHSDGTPVLDADGTERTPGDFTLYGSYYAPGATIADLDLNGTWEIIAPTWDSKELYVFEPNGDFQPGFPVTTGSSVWSSAAVGNIDADANPEIVFSSNDNKVFAYNWDGTEVMDGDANGATIGVFKVLSQPFNYSSPALADLDNDGRLDIILAGFDGFLYAWKHTGANLPGFPINLFAGTTSSPAVGDIDNDGQLEIAITATSNKLYVYNQDGTTQPGFPISGVMCNGVSRLPSPIFADMEGNGQKCVVINTTDGFLRVYRPNGTVVPAWSNVRYTTALAGASECSPVAADIDGDGQNEILVGGEDANLSAFDNGALMAGFPIKLGGEVRGSPVVWDIDHDQLTEILVAGWDKNVYVWDYPGVFSPNSPPAWAMWRHDQFRTGRLSSPIVVSVGGVAFSAQNRSTSGVELSFALPSVGDADGQYDVFRATGPGETGEITYAMPLGFERITREPLQGVAGSLLTYNDASALPGTTYRYLLVRRQTRPGETFLAYGPFAAEVTAEAPAAAYLAQSYPNPAPAGRPSAIAYGIPGDGAALKHVVVKLYDVRGRAVRTLVNESVPPGRYQATWDGKDDHGVRVTPGVYFYELAAGADRLTKKALVIAP